MKLKNLTKEEKTSAYARCGRHGGKRTDKYPLLLTALVLVVLSLTYCSDEISYRKLPEKARNFIEIYFPEQSCVYAERDRDNGQKEYEVRLSNGTEIEFYESGDWKSVDCKYSFLPKASYPKRSSRISQCAIPVPEFMRPNAKREAMRYPSETVWS